MKRVITLLVMALMLLALVWGQAAPVMAGGGDDHPWTGEDNNSGTGQFRIAQSLLYSTGIFSVDLVFYSQLLFEDPDEWSEKSEQTDRKLLESKEKDTYTDRLRQASME